MNPKVGLIYAALGFLVGALTQVMQVAIAVSLSPIESPGKWAIAAGAGIIAAGVARALPYLKAVLPDAQPPA